MRTAAALFGLALLGALTAFALPRTSHAANPVLIASVDDTYAITLTDADGHAVTSLPAGTYDIQVHDPTAFHNFHLSGPGVDEMTTVAGTTDTVWTGVVLSPGSYHFQCDAHVYSMNGDFVVTGGTATTTTETATQTNATTGTTSPPPPATTAAPPPAPVVRCNVPRVVRLTLRRARTRISRANCRTGRVTRRRAGRHGIVLAQRPRAGTRLRVGGRVNLTVSR